MLIKLKYTTGSFTSCLICLPPFQSQALKTGHPSSAKVPAVLSEQLTPSPPLPPHMLSIHPRPMPVCLQQIAISCNFPSFSVELLLGHNYSPFYSCAFDFSILGTELGAFLCGNSSS